MTIALTSFALKGLERLVMAHINTIIPETIIPDTTPIHIPPKQIHR
jgi:hypothetical protein